MSSIVTINHFFKLFLLKNKPEQLPYSKITWWLLFTAANSLFFFFNGTLPHANILFLVFLLQNITFLATVYYFLKRYNIANRFVQTSANFLGLSIVNNILLKVLLTYTKSNLLICMFFSWVIMLKIYIIQHSFEIPRARAFLLLGIFLITPALAATMIAPLLPQEIVAGLVSSKGL